MRTCPICVSRTHNHLLQRRVSAHQWVRPHELYGITCAKFIHVVICMDSAHRQQSTAAALSERALVTTPIWIVWYHARKMHTRRNLHGMHPWTTIHSRAGASVHQWVYAHMIYTVYDVRKMYTGRNSRGQHAQPSTAAPSEHLSVVSVLIVSAHNRAAPHSSAECTIFRATRI